MTVRTPIRDPSTAIVRPLSSTAWELRTCWARGLRVAVSLDRCDMDRVEGHVRSVAATGAFAVIAGVAVPLDRVLAVHRPSRLGDSTVQAGERWAASRPRVLMRMAGQEELPGLGSGERTEG